VYEELFGIKDFLPQCQLIALCELIALFIFILKGMVMITFFYRRQALGRAGQIVARAVSSTDRWCWVAVEGRF